ncbi:helix-turn-helix transcriptional regulator [Bifidobacterium dentium]|uniref:helix-turn-helix transcriptional regulator n=1 Tax=Bifidobacterium dentium TaxID=1689 RepID=UPI003CC89F1D
MAISPLRSRPGWTAWPPKRSGDTRPMSRASKGTGMEDRMLRSREAARMIGISPRTLAKWRQRGIGPQCVRLGYNLVIYRLSDIDAWIREHEA